MGKAQKQQSRRELIEKMQREQERSDRRRTIIIVVVALVIGLGLISYPAFKVYDEYRLANQSMADIGASPSAASCDAVTDDNATGGMDHKPEGTPIKYTQSPPSSGSHYEIPAPFEKKFYTAADRPAISTLVHNLEHGYSILWYDETIAKDGDKVGEIERISKSKLPGKSNGKFIAAPWKAADGAAWPAGKHIAFSHWSAPTNPKDQKSQKGHRQFCEGISGEALQQFMEKYPSSDSPEPNAA